MRDKYQYLLDLADSYIEEIKKLRKLQEKSFSELRESEIERLNRKCEDILVKYERFHFENGGD